LNKHLLCLLISSFLLASLVDAEATGQLSIWEVSVDFVPPAEEHLQLFLDINNPGTETITGIELSVVADELEYIETEALSLGDDATSNKLDVTIKQEQGKSIASVMFPAGLEQGQSKRIILDFNSQGLLRKQGEGYTTTLNFDEPMIILQNGEKVAMNVDTGSFRVNIPNGFVYTAFEPTPWREIWQGVSGYGAHFVLIFDGGTSLTTTISASFKESQIIQRAVGIHERILAMESEQTLPQEQLDKANRRVTGAANQVILGDPALAEIELDKAEAILTGQPLEEFVFKPAETDDSSGNDIFILGIVFVILVLFSVIFGRKIISQ